MHLINKKSFVIEPISRAIKKKQKEVELNKVALFNVAIVSLNRIYNGKMSKSNSNPLIGLQTSSCHPSFS